MLQLGFNKPGLDHSLSQPPLSQTKLFSLTRPSSRNRIRKSQSVKAHYIASQVNATWFSSLPLKVQQHHFTPEEQLLLAGNRDLVMLDAADEALYRRGRLPSTSMSPLPSRTTPLSHLEQKESMNLAGAATADEPTAGPLLDMDDSLYHSFRWLDEDDDLDLTLDHYHDAVAATTSPPTQRRYRRIPDLRRTLSLNSVKPRRSSLSHKLDPLSGLSTAPSPGSTIQKPTRHSSNPLADPLRTRQCSLSSIDPSAKHYQDPEARLKLRVYLASPQKFDEAVEFGFPSLEDTTFRPPAAPSAVARNTPEPERTFLDDAASSKSDEDDNDGGLSLTETDSPRTPLDAALQSSSRPSQKNSMDRTAALRPLVLRTSPEPYAQNPPGGREMTLHMTLTRPDLRIGMDTITASADGEDPLKLADLVLADERLLPWDSVTEDQSKMKHWWKKITTR